MKANINETVKFMPHAPFMNVVVKPSDVGTVTAESATSYTVVVNGETIVVAKWTVIPTRYVK